MIDESVWKNAPHAVHLSIVLYPRLLQSMHMSLNHVLAGANCGQAIKQADKHECDVFLSYSWSNSASAFKRGQVPQLIGAHLRSGPLPVSTLRLRACCRLGGGRPAEDCRMLDGRGVQHVASAN